MYNGKDAVKSGVQLLTTYSLLESGQSIELPSWKDLVYNFQCLSPEDIKNLGLPDKYVSGFVFGTYVIEQKYYLKYLTDTLLEKDVKFMQRKISQLHELFDENFDILINCTGLGAFDVVNDKSMYPVRGQVLRVRYG